MSESHCVMYLHRRVIEAENAARRGRWVGGKVYNFLTGSDAEHVAISGAVLVTVYRALDRQPPIELHAMGEYVMRYPDAKHLKTAFEAKMKEKGVIV